MKVELEIKDDKELRAVIKDMIRGQVTNIVREEIKNLVAKEVEKKTDPRVLSTEIQRFFRDSRMTVGLEGKVNDAVHALVTEEIKESIERRVRESNSMTADFVDARVRRVLRELKVTL